MTTRRTIIVFVARLIVVSAMLFALWEWVLYAQYAAVFGKVANVVYAMLGYRLADMQDAIGLVVTRFYNFIPFVSLMIASVGLGLKRRLIGLGIGVVILFVWHLTFILIVSNIIATHGLGRDAYQRLSPWFLSSDALPFLLWVAAAYPSLAMFFPKRKSPGDPDPAA